MAEVLVRFTERVAAEDGTSYGAQACGGIADDGLWEGWIEFVSPSGTAVRTARETEQPNRDDLLYPPHLTRFWILSARTRKARSCCGASWRRYHTITWSASSRPTSCRWTRSVRRPKPVSLMALSEQSVEVPANRPAHSSHSLCTRRKWDGAPRHSPTRAFLSALCFCVGAPSPVDSREHTVQWRADPHSRQRPRRSRS